MEIKKNPYLNEELHINVLSSGTKCYIIPKKDYVEKLGIIGVEYGSTDNRFIWQNREIASPAGMAHFLEHKLFEEEGGNIFDKFTNLGAFANAFTNFKNTAYYFSAVNKFTEGLKLLLSFVQNPYFTDENVEKEKSIIEQEIYMYEDDPGWRALFNLLDAMYAVNSVKEKIGGTVESIRMITKEELYKCHKAFYQPSNMVLVCVGDFDPQEINDIAEQCLHSQNSELPKRLYEPEKCGVVKRFVKSGMPVSRYQFLAGIKDPIISYEGNSLANKMFGIKILLDMIFTESGDFYNHLYSKGLIDESFYFEYDNGISYGHSILAGYSKNPEDFMQEFTAHCNNLKENGLSGIDFDRIKKKHKGRFIRGFNNINAIALSQLEYAFKALDLFDCMESIDTIQLDDITKLLHEHIAEENMSLSVIEPN